ncbi:hypothetical protein [Pandoraea bronchicola]|uniref:hypothetical protein n=1 Tax=Pandoraea bronchicola TaxID=2508287 RepID=UPI001241E802|nr:hypothetical protein [Pandoraea bronchicola]
MLAEAILGPAPRQPISLASSPSQLFKFSDVPLSQNAFALRRGNFVAAQDASAVVAVRPQLSERPNSSVKAAVSYGKFYELRRD